MHAVAWVNLPEGVGHIQTKRIYCQKTLCSILSVLYLVSDFFLVPRCCLAVLAVGREREEEEEEEAASGPSLGEVGVRLPALSKKGTLHHHVRPRL